MRTKSAGGVVFGVLLLVLGSPLEGWAARPYRGGALATAHPEASEAALQMLERGGNAVDAAVAAALVLGVVAPYHSGIGGGGFALVHKPAAGEQGVVNEVFDFREVAPKAASRDMFVRDGKVVPGLSTDGALSVAVPGAARGYLELLARHGKLSAPVVLAPAIRLARNGFWVTPKYRAMAAHRRDCLAKDVEAARQFLVAQKDGSFQVPEVGQVIRQPQLARTLEALAARGPKAFYAGPIAEAIAKTVQEKGGILTKEDLRAYETRVREPLEASYRGHRILTMPPPSAGGLAIAQVLGALDQAPAFGYRDPRGVHLFVELLRRAYVDRTRYLGDPAFVKIPLEALSSRKYTAAMLGSVDRDRATSSQSLLPSPEGASTLEQGAVERSSGTGGLDGGSAPHEVKTPAFPEKKNTTHVSVIDRAGNAVAMTTTVNYGFGSCIVAKGTGVLLNDEMDDFSAQPFVPNAYGLVGSEANAIAPGKIPLSSMSPTLVFQKGRPNEVMLAVGSPGGSTIPTTVMQTIVNVVDHGMDVARAVGHGRVHHQYLPDVLMWDRWGAEPATLEALKRMGHTLQHAEAWGDAEVVYVDPATGLRYAASDPRNEGAALGQD